MSPEGARRVWNNRAGSGVLGIRGTGGAQNRLRGSAPRLVLLLLLLSVALAVNLVLSQPGWGAPVKVKIWDHHIHDKKFKQSIFREFNKKNPDVQIDYTSQISMNYDMVLQAAFQVGEMPDIFAPAGTMTMSRLVESGRLMPLNKVAPSEEALKKWMAKFPGEMQPFADNINVFDGKVYSWPIGTEGGRMMLFYNTKLFRDAGLVDSKGRSLEPETWSDMRDFAKKITTLGKGKFYGITHGIKNPQVWDQDIFWSLAPSSGWSLIQLDFRTGRFDYRYPGLRGSIQLWLDMRDDGSVMPGDFTMDDEQAKYQFANDKAGMIFGGPWVPGGLIAVKPNAQFDVVLPPIEIRGVRKGYLGRGVLAGASEYVVSATTKNPRAVWKVIEFLTSKEFQEGWVKAGGGTSVFREYNRPELFPHPTIAKIAEMGFTGKRTWPPLPKGHERIWEYFDPGKPRDIDIMQGMWIRKLGWDAWDDYERRTNAAWGPAFIRAQADGLKLKPEDFVFPDWDPSEDYPPPKKTGK